VAGKSAKFRVLKGHWDVRWIVNPNVFSFYQKMVGLAAFIKYHENSSMIFYIKYNNFKKPEM
jgi:hypothetical protein